MAIYVKVDGVDGNVTSKGHEKWIECLSFQFGVGRSIPMYVGKQTQREATAPSLSEITLSKEFDDSSPYLFQESVKGISKTVNIHITKTGAGELDNVVEYILSDCLLSGYSVSTAGEAPQESLSLAYTKIEMKYIKWDEAHKKASQVPVSYDLGTATAS